MKPVLAVFTFLMAVTVAWPAAAQEPASKMSAQQREQEKKAATAFVAGRYDEALNIYANLYAEYRDPLYLRNIGRCHQRLGDPDRAISSFEDYLTRRKRSNPREDQEIQGYLREMRALKEKRDRERAAAAAAAATPPPPVAATPAPVAPAPAPVPVGPSPYPGGQPAPGPAPLPGPYVQQQPPPGAWGPAPQPMPPPGVAGGVQATAPAPAESAPWPTMRKAGVGALVVGALLGAGGGGLLYSSWSKHKAANGPCVNENNCQQAADAVSTRNLWSKILFGAAAVAGVTGVVLIAVTPPSGPEGHLAASARWTF